MFTQKNGKLPNEILNGSYNWSSKEIEIVLLLISELRQDQLERNNFSSIELDLNVFLNLYKDQNNRKKLFRSDLIEILKRPFEYLDLEQRIYFAAAIFVSYEIHEKRELIKFLFNPEMAKLLILAKENYTRYNFETLLKLRGKYSKRIYLYGNSWINKSIFTLKLETLRKRLKLENQYEKYADFNKRVIAPAIEEINEISELQMNAEPVKQGKEVIEILFTVQIKKTFRVTPDEQQLVLLRSYGLHDWQIQNVVHQISAEDLRPFIRTIQTNRSHIKNPAAYLLKSLEKIGVIVNRKIEIGEKLL
jgi:plasmid replication initiation protein